jgi:hypothetical protein
MRTSREQTNRRAIASIVAAALLLSTLAGAATGATRVAAGKVPSWQPGRPPSGLGFGFGSAWIKGGTLLRIDPRTNRKVGTLVVRGDAGWPVAVGDSLWLSNAGEITKVDPATNQVVGKIAVDTSTRDSMAYGFGSLWIATREGRLLRVDLATAKVVADVRVQGPADWSPQIATGLGSVWVASGDEHAVIRVDPETNEVAATIGGISKIYSLLTVGVGFDSVWAHASAAASGRGILYRIDPATGKVVSALTTSRRVGDPYGGTNIAIGGGSIWTANGNGTVSRISPRPLGVVRTTTPPFKNPLFVGFAFGSVWIQDGDTGRAIRIPAAKFGRG